jgi:hypothetical protein
MFDIDWVGLSVPFAYITVLVGSLITFSSVYRKRKAGQEFNVGDNCTSADNMYSQVRNTCAVVPTAYATQHLSFFVARRAS